ncbi:MAG: flagellar export chaperone FlgN [Plesiomonas sp.]|uniref:flagellar export chaperone FlgN n=1 Tax=Plesiomonas sp. TaxID=2486279 RepID=UPI003F410587
MTLHALLTQQQITLQTLDQLIDSELTALTEHQADQLLTLSEQKNVLLQTLQTTDQQIAQHPERAQLKQQDALLLTVQQLLQSCQTKNHLLGEIMKEARISLSRLANQLMAVRGKEMMTYNADGKTLNTSTLGNNVKV